MKKNFLAFYKIPLLISATFSVVFLGVTITRDPIDIILVILGFLLGTFVLDIEYFLYAYFFETDEEFSVNLRGYVKDKDLFGAFGYIYSHQSSIKEKSLNSSTFQIVLSLICIFIAFAQTPVFIKSLIISVFANSIYKLLESYYQNTLDEWFWSFKNKPTRNEFIIYLFVMIFIFVFCIAIL